MDLPPEIKTRNSLLKEYCELRIKCYELMYKSVADDTPQYRYQIEVYHAQIDAKLNELDSGIQSINP